MSRDIAGWQKRFFANTKVFEVYAQGESSGNFYETQEGADIEVAWRRRRGEKGVRVVYHNLHSDELSRERWIEPVEARSPGTGGGE